MRAGAPQTSGNDEELRQKLDAWAEAAARYVVENYRGEIGALITTTVARWNGEETSDKLELAEQNLKRAADQLRTNSIIQDHYGDVLLKLGRYDEAIAAFTRALAGDGDSIDKGEVDKKIRTARQKLPKK